MKHYAGVAAIAALLLACGGGRQYGTVEFGELRVEGEVQQDYLSLQLGQLDPTFEACYVRALRNNRSAEGVIELKLTGGSGRLVPELTGNDTGSDGLGECVQNAVAQLSIVEPAGYEAWDFTGEWSVRFEIIRSSQ
jgi:hypothetical protein